MKRFNRLRLLSALPLLCCGPALAATIYKSVDANGVVSFSDTKPEQAVLVETVVIDVQEPSSEVTQQRLQDMRETTDRMVADRMARERHRAEMRQLDAQTAAQHRSQGAPEDLTDYYTSPVIFGGYSPFPARRPWRHPNRPRPEHPIARPPLLPPGLHRSSSTRPLPSNDYPASLVRRHYDPKVRASLDKK
jgi:hypothetical protein